ncbi:MAG TPA: 2-hydroxy-3-oxopropionate reductase [Candidatus Atribacteria bacterium]|nr:2-hydroxy-3-oxopropionate reductase [Candidatus Atribacteria bacterium]
MAIKPTIGFIGLGIMGKPMCRNLLQAGYPVVVYTRTKSKIEEMVKEGAQGAKTPREVGEKSEVVITMLPDAPQVEEVILGERGVIKGIERGKIVVDMSSIDPLSTRRIGEVLVSQGVEMLDAPVSGGEEGAIKGDLSIMVGGKKEVFEKCLPIFQVLGKTITYVGELGSGEMTKLINQIIVAVNLAALGEAFTLGAKAGLKAETMYQALRGGMAGSKVMDMKVPRWEERNFTPGFKIDLHLKDLKNALVTAQEMKVPLPFTSLVKQVMITLSGKGEGEKDHGAMIKFWEELSQIEVK